MPGGRIGRAVRRLFCKYATKRCFEEEPKLEQIHENQQIRCFYPNKEERNSDEHKKITVNH